MIANIQIIWLKIELLLRNQKFTKQKINVGEYKLLFEAKQKRKLKIFDSNGRSRYKSRF